MCIGFCTFILYLETFVYVGLSLFYLHALVDIYEFNIDPKEEFDAED